MMQFGSTLQDWREAYRAGTITPKAILNELLKSLDSSDPVWISVASPEQLNSQIDALPKEAEAVRALPLYGIPFAVKDNIDVKGFITTAACRAFAYEAKEDAHAVALLREAGAVVIAKTNMDQFATGLVGVRSPYGVPENPFNADYVPGGSSSGSAVAVARGTVPFALGTDTAGSGRVPAGFNNIVGWKPTRGLVSSRGVVPACRTLDCVSVFALTVDDADTIGNIIGEFDSKDPYSREKRDVRAGKAAKRLHFAIPSEENWFGDGCAHNAWIATLEKLKAEGAEFTPVDFSPMHELAEILYGDAWVAERTAAIGAFAAAHPGDIHPVIAKILNQGKTFSAANMWRAEYRRAELALRIRTIIEPYTALLVPTAPRFPTISEVHNDPIAVNASLGAYTNFVNLADCCALAMPGIPRNDGLPAGITLIAGPWREKELVRAGRRLEDILGWTLGATGRALRREPPAAAIPKSAGRISVAVAGAHLSGLPLNQELISHGAEFVRKTKTSTHYRLYRIKGTTPPKPGLVFCEKGMSIDVEIWSLSPSEFGMFVAGIPAPMTIGTIELENGETCKGFLCEPCALQNAEDITAFGGWKNYISSRTGTSRS